jgi:hypothetical protein
VFLDLGECNRYDTRRRFRRHTPAYASDGRTI